MYRHIHMHTNVHTSELGNETNPNRKQGTLRGSKLMLRVSVWLSKSQVTKEDAWLLISLAHKVTCQVHQAQMLAHFYTPILQHSGRTGINNPHVFI